MTATTKKRDSEVQRLVKLASSGNKDAEAELERALKQARGKKAKAGTVTGVECLKTDWQTPERIIERARVYFNGPIPLDVATSRKNPTKALRFFTAKTNGLAHAWDDPWWCNPPYGRETRTWLAAMAEEAASGVPGLALLTCSRYEQAYLTDTLNHSKAVCYIRKRVSFINPATGDPVNGNPYANQILGFNVDINRFRAAFTPLGACYATRPL